MTTAVLAYLKRMARERSGGASVFAAIAVILPPLAAYGPKLDIPLSLLMLAVLLLVSRKERELPQGLARWILFIAAALPAWGFATSIWSVAPDRSIRAGFDVSMIVAGAAALFAFAAKVDHASAKCIPPALLAGLSLALAIYIVEYAGDGYLVAYLHGEAYYGPDELFSAFNRGLAVLSLLLWPTVLWLLRCRKHAAALAFATVGTVTVFAYYGTSIKVALASGIFVAILTLPLRRQAARVMAVLVITGLLLSPVLARIAGDKLDPRHTFGEYSNVSVPHRLIIWDFVSHRIPERWLGGWGLEAARKIPGADAKVVVKLNPEPQYRDQVPNHPHNAFLQIWLELGLVGVTLAGLGLVALFEMVHRISDPMARAFTLGQIVTGVGIACLSFGLWQAWWLVSLVLVAVLTRLVICALPSQVAFMLQKNR